MPRRARPLVALLFGAVLSLILLEAGLWIASAFVRVAPRTAQPVGARSVLCVGDSNTYGIHLAAEDSYPGQLQAFLTEAGQPLSVVNQGFPGQNSAQVRSGLVEVLAETAPEAVVAWVGVNDRWSEAERHVWSESGFWSGLFERSRVVKLVRILATPGGAGPTAGARLGLAGFEGAGKDRENRKSEETRASIRANLEAMAELCAERGARLLLVTYPIFLADVQSDVNGTIRAVAAERGLELVDLEVRFEELLADLAPHGIYLPNDTHLSAVGNHEAARQVLLALARAGIAEVAEPPPPLEERFRGIELEARRAGDSAVVTLSGPAEWSWRIQLSGLHDGAGRVQAPVEDTGLPPKELRRWRGRFDATGLARTRIRVPGPPADETWISWEISAIAHGPGPRDFRFSGPAPFTDGE